MTYDDFSASKAAPVDLAHGHAAHTAGYDVGFAHGQARASEELARDWLHRDARMWTDMAVRTAAAHHGEEWSRAIAAQAGA